MSFLLTKRPKMSQIREELRAPEGHKHTYIPEQLCIERWRINCPKVVLLPLLGCRFMGAQYGAGSISHVRPWGWGWRSQELTSRSAGMMVHLPVRRRQAIHHEGFGSVKLLLELGISAATRLGHEEVLLCSAAPDPARLLQNEVVLQKVLSAGRNLLASCSPDPAETVTSGVLGLTPRRDPRSSRTR